MNNLIQFAILGIHCVSRVRSNCAHDLLHAGSGRSRKNSFTSLRRWNNFDPGFTMIQSIDLFESRRVTKSISANGAVVSSWPELASATPLPDGVHGAVPVVVAEPMPRWYGPVRCRAFLLRPPYSEMQWQNQKPSCDQQLLAANVHRWLNDGGSEPSPRKL